MRAEFQALDGDDRANQVNLRAKVFDDAGEHVATVARLAPDRSRHSVRREATYVCGCWKSNGLTVQRRHCPHIQCVEAAVAAAEPTP